MIADLVNRHVQLRCTAALHCFLFDVGLLQLLPELAIVCVAIGC